MMLSFLLLNWLLWPIVQTQLNLWNTDETLDINYLRINCLHYYTGIDPNLTEKTEYCLELVDTNNLSSDDFLNIRDRNFTFDQLRQLNVTTKELLSWSAAIDLAEQYQYYIDHLDNSFVSEAIFFNCTIPWFGPRCQYSFGLGDLYSFQEIVTKTLKKTFGYKSPYSITNLTCYIHLKCDRGGSRMCLDWREVCNGRIDCVDGGADEAFCFDLEVNECDENEYRCHIGVCIPKEFFEDNMPQCLDQSDMIDVVSFRALYPNMFAEEEHSCRPGHEQFVCGDSTCVTDFDRCKNQRHLLLIESVSAQGNLSYTCWMGMVCLTKILDRVNGTSCDQFVNSSNISTYLQTCEDLIQFPTVPVLFGHVCFLYRSANTLNWNINLSLIPDYICYDQQLCDFLTPTYFHGNYSCRQSYEFGFDWSVKPKNWASLMNVVERYFHKCSTRYKINTNNSHQSSLYCCKNSSKCISKHRILDSISDCYLNDDEEEFELSCSIHDVLRFKCSNENKCYSHVFSQDTCSPWGLLNFNELEFREICDRHVQAFSVTIDGQTHTDETDCERWPCSNFYTRCDGFWSCPNGEDEENCTQQMCPSGTFPCVSPYNYTLSCLPANQVGNGHIDCLGSLDERQHCRTPEHLRSGYFGFRCLSDDKCVGIDDLCDKKAQCPLNDDEGFCKNNASYEICDALQAVDRTDVENAICFTYSDKRIQSSLKSSLVYPPSKIQTTERIAQQPIERHNVENFITNEPDDRTWPWRCNHGLYVRHWLDGNNFSYKCFCPPSYYGDLCQYQNQRISFTAKLRVMNPFTIYTIIISLIDDDDDREEIQSYHQYTWKSSSVCEQNFNAYLTYATRPKNSSKNYSIRVDVFNKTDLTYLASWHFTIPFSFLPVNRMAVVLHAPSQQIASPTDCPLTCHNSDCMKYMNKEKFFCRCHIGWSGARCDIPVRCSDCSINSTCIGMIQNRSICVCPLHKGGSRCLLTLSCPEEICENNGQCFVLDDGMNAVGFACVCPEEFFGWTCEVRKKKLEIAFPNIKVSSFLLIYLFSVRESPAATQIGHKVAAKKLTMFQRTVSLLLLDTFQMAFVKTDGTYYLAVLQYNEVENISISIDADQRCPSITELSSRELLAWPEIRRVKYYHVVCQTHLNLMCFVDEPYMCLCNLERHANCFKFDSTPPKCQDNFHCQHGAECLQDDVLCPVVTMCNCTDCFFGERCQLYAKGIGLTLDDILRYEIRPNVTIYAQTNIVKWSSALTMVMFVAGLIDSVLGILTFRTKPSREVGCGLYLMASSIISLLTMSIFTIKFWFLILTQINPSVSRSVLRGGCLSLEFILKVCLYVDNWLNACVAIERSMTIHKGVSFNKMLSKRVARWIIIILPLLIMASLIHEPLYRDLFYDSEEQRLWCVVHYLSSVQNYNTIISFLHYIGPFCANLFSALFIIYRSARRRAAAQKRQTYNQHLREQFNQHRNLIISPIVLIILTLPRLLISFSTGCVKKSHNAWLYLSGYLISFIPSMTLFFIFILPSEFYREQLRETFKSWRR